MKKLLSIMFALLLIAQILPAYAEEVTEAAFEEKGIVNEESPTTRRYDESRSRCSVSPAHHERCCPGLRGSSWQAPWLCKAARHRQLKNTDIVLCRTYGCTAVRV